MRVHIQTHPHIFLPVLQTPNLCKAEEITLIRREAINFYITLSLFGHFKRIVGYGHTTDIGCIFADSQGAFHVYAVEHSEAIVEIDYLLRFGFKFFVVLSGQQFSIQS